MHTFYAVATEGETAFLSNDDEKHICRVLRWSGGEEMVVVANGIRRRAILSCANQKVCASLLEDLPSTEAKTRITLYQGISKGERMDYTVQKCTELGFDAIIPCVMSRCVVKDGAAKVERWNRIAYEAAKQAQRTRFPLVCEPLSFERLCLSVKKHHEAFVPWEETQGMSLRKCYAGGRDVALIIGPEGGITPEEIALLPAKAVTLGPRILRTETAGVVAGTIILSLSEDLE